MQVHAFIDEAICLSRSYPNQIQADQIKFFKVFLPQILLGLFLNTLPQLIPYRKTSREGTIIVLKSNDTIYYTVFRGSYTAPSM